MSPFLKPYCWASLLVAAVLFFSPQGAYGQQCAEREYCLVVEEGGDGVVIYVQNLRPFEITVALDVVLENAEADGTLPLVATYPPLRRTRALRVRQKDPARQMRYRFTSRWRVGSLDAGHDDAVVYGLPYAPGKAYPVIQGFDGSFSHQGLFAIDWRMPERTPVAAARAGVVAEVEDRYTEGGLEERIKGRANRILIRHDDGTLGGYYHLAANGVFVRVGQRVAPGQVIGVSGNTGFSGGPHLHFEVYKLTADLERKTLPIRFDLGLGRPTTPEEGQAYTAPLR